MKYTEDFEVSKSYKQKYFDGLKNILKSRQKDAENIRDEYAKNIFSAQEIYREDLKKMLGWPLTGCNEKGIKGIETTLLSEEDGYKIYRMQFEMLNGLVMTGLLFKQNGGEKKPLVLVQHGGHGTPELISGIYGDTFNYNDMLQRVRKNDVHVFAPQLLLWHDKYEVEYDRRAFDAELKRVGSSITAIEVFGLMRILDYFEKQEYVSDFGMVGLSYGGFYTLFTAALDTRIKSAISCAYFNKRDAIGWSDWVWENSALKFDDAEVACLVYPRKLKLAIGDADEIFNFKFGLESFEKVKKMSKEVGCDWVSLDVFHGVHEFFYDDEPIRKLINDIK